MKRWTKKETHIYIIYPMIGNEIVEHKFSSIYMNIWTITINDIEGGIGSNLCI